ncbi:MAG TPA: hypothetical protein VF189_05800 [Patescibacteria group bacterium]
MPKKDHYSRLAIGAFLRTYAEGLLALEFVFAHPASQDVTASDYGFAIILGIAAVFDLTRAVKNGVQYLRSR